MRYVLPINSKIGYLGRVFRAEFHSPFDELKWPGDGVCAMLGLPTCRSQRRSWSSDILGKMQPYSTSSKSPTSCKPHESPARQTTSSPRPECIHRTNDHAPAPAGESNSKA